MKMMNKMVVLIGFIVISFILYCVTFHDAGAGYLFNLIFGIPFVLGIVIWVLAEFFTVSLLFVLDDDYSKNKDW